MAGSLDPNGAGHRLAFGLLSLRRLVRESMYAFAAFAPSLGSLVSLVLPTANTAAMNLFLEHLSLRPHLIATDQAGNVWYSGGFDGDIGEFTPRSGNGTQFVVYHSTCSSPTKCTGTHISGITVDTKGNVWFTDSLSQRVGYLIPSTGQAVVRTTGVSNVHPNDGLMIDRSERVWFTEEFGSTLAMWPASAIK